ncbi:hypothetical protein GCM10009818_12230 [Nakamurella flavida]
MVAGSPVFTDSNRMSSLHSCTTSFSAALRAGAVAGWSAGIPVPTIASPVGAAMVVIAGTSAVARRAPGIE